MKHYFKPNTFRSCNTSLEFEKLWIKKQKLPLLIKNSN